MEDFFRDQPTQGHQHSFPHFDPPSSRQQQKSENEPLLNASPNPVEGLSETPSPTLQKPSLDNLPNEMILLILNHLAPHIFFLFGCLSRRYHHIVPRHFPPDGRVGIVVELVDKSNIVRFGSTGQRRERVLLDFFSRFRLAPAWNFVKGRKVVASLDLLIEHSLLSSNVDFGAIAAGMDELGNFTFAGVSKIGGLDGTAPLDWIISWLSKPISKPEKFSFGKQTALELLSIPRTLLFPGISHVDVSCGTTADVRQIHQTQQRGLFPSSQSIYIWSMSFQIANIRCLIHALTGMNSMSLKEVGIGFGIDEEQGRNYVFLIPQIVAAIPH